MGSKVNGGLLGQTPELVTDPKKDLQYTTDFRSIYSSVLDKWLKADSSKILGQPFDHVPFV